MEISRPRSPPSKPARSIISPNPPTPTTSKKPCSRAAARGPNPLKTRCLPTGFAGSISSASMSFAITMFRKRRAASACTGEPCSEYWPSARRKRESGLTVDILEILVDRERAGFRIELQKIKPVGRRPAGGDDDAAGLFIIAGPVRTVAVVDRQTRRLDRLCRLGEVEDDEAVDRRRALPEEPSGARRHAAHVAGKPVHEFGLRLLARKAGDAFKAAGERLHVDGPVGADARFFGADMRVSVGADIEIFRLQKLQVGKTPEIGRAHV